MDGVAATAIMESNTSISVSQAEFNPHSSFNCALCNVSFRDNTQQRTHMKSPWHVYNLKRRMASLPSLKEEVFQTKVQIESVQKKQAPSGGECSTCQQIYDTAKKYQTHLKSRNHLQKLVAVTSDNVESDEGEDAVQYLASVASQIENLKIDDSIEEEEEEEEEDEEIDSAEDSEEIEIFDEEICLFCLLDSQDLAENMSHMQKAHGLFIPNQEGLTDPGSFLAYLNTLIAQFHECLYCGCTRNSAEGARAHMLAKGHCMINLDSDELGEFWDDGQETMKGKLETETGDEKMALPGGRVIGRRDLAKRYRQHLPSIAIRAQRRAIAAADLEETPETSSSANQDRRLATRIPNTEMGLIGLTDVEKRSLRVVERKMMKIEMRARNNYQSQLEKGANRQKFFKPDVPGPQNG